MISILDLRKDGWTDGDIVALKCEEMRSRGKDSKEIQAVLEEIFLNPHNQSHEERKQLEKSIKKLFTKINCPYSRLGRRYLQTAILYTIVNNVDIRESDDLFRIIAGIHDTKESRVYKKLRTMNEGMLCSCLCNQNPFYLDLFDDSVDFGTRMPSVEELVYAMSEAIQKGEDFR